MLSIIKIEPNSFFYSITKWKEKQDKKSKKAVKKPVSVEKEMSFAFTLTDDQFKTISQKKWIKGFEEFINKNEDNEQKLLFKKELMNLRHGGKMERDVAGVELLASYPNLSPGSINIIEEEVISSPPVIPNPLSTVNSSIEESPSEDINFPYISESSIGRESYQVKTKKLSLAMAAMCENISLNDFLEMIDDTKAGKISLEKAKRLEQTIEKLLGD